ncbi:MAG: hypothetical protein NC247_02195 [Ruminococcus flavefaciens]|nr:hypothetical protein [Ruminococcus flavefaciens]
MELIFALMIGFVLIMTFRNTNKRQDTKPATKGEIVVEVSDPFLVEKIRNLNESQEIYNAKISNLQAMNEELQHEVDNLKAKIKANYDNVKIQLQVNPSSDVSILMAQCDASNEVYIKRQVRIQGQILDNEEKIVKYKEKSNKVSIDIDKIGHEEYRRQANQR